MRWVAASTSIALLLLPITALATVCTNPPGVEGDQFYNTSYKVMQYCNGTNWMNMGSIGPGAYGSIGTLTSGDFCTTDGSMVNCTTAAINLSTQVNGVLQAAQFPALSGDVTTGAGSLATTVAKINGVALGSTTASAGNLLIGSGSNWVSTPISGDITVSSGGVTSIGNGKVTNANLAGSINVSKIAATGTPSSANFLRGDGSWSSSTSQWVTTGSDIYYSTGKVGIGSATPGANLDVVGNSSFVNTTNNAFALYAASTATTGGAGLTAIASSSTGMAVQAVASATSGVNYAVYATSNSASGYGIYSTGAGINYFANYVGIGTTAPVRHLHINYPNAEAAIVLSRGDGLANNKNWRIFTNNGGAGTAGTLYFDLLNDAGTAVTTAGMAITSSGFVGVGTYSPTVPLDVYGSISIRDGYNLTWGGSYGNHTPAILGIANTGLSFLPDGSTGSVKVSFNASGNVGIGTASAASKLHVYGGDIKLDGGQFNIAATAGQTASQLYSYNNASSLWLIQPTTQSLILGDTVNYDRGVNIQYTAGATGGQAGQLIIGQTNKNSANYTHGITSFYTNGSERLRIDSTGNVGIGTIAPGGKLHLAGATNGSSLIVQQDDTQAAPTGLTIRSTSNPTQELLIGYNNMGGYGSIQSINLGTGSKPLVLQPSGGTVGIGTISPAYALDVSGDIRANGWLRTQGTTGWYNNDYGGGWYMADSTWIRSYGNKAVFMYSGFDTSSASGVGCNGGMGNGAMFRVCGSMQANIFYDNDNTAFYVDPASTSNMNAITVASLSASTASGNAVVGYTTANASALLGTAPSGWGIFCNGANCGGSSAWNNVSDRRLKKDISDLPDDKGLASILKLRPVTFHWKDAQKDAASGEQLGFIAQEMQLVFPQIVRISPDTKIIDRDGKKEQISKPKSLTYSDLVVPLVKAVQELKFDNDNLHAANDDARRAVVELRQALKAANDRYRSLELKVDALIRPNSGGAR